VSETSYFVRSIPVIMDCEATVCKANRESSGVAWPFCRHLGCAFAKHPVSRYLLPIECEAMVTVCKAHNESSCAQEMCSSPGITICRHLECDSTSNKWACYQTYWTEFNYESCSCKSVQEACSSPGAMLARNSTLQSMKKAACLQACTIVQVVSGNKKAKFALNPQSLNDF